MAPKGTRASDYDFHLPPDLIAQAPAARRDESRLLVVHREAGTLEHRRFRDLAAYIPAGDLLAVNTTRVFRARLLGHRDSGAPAEVLLLRPLGKGRWEAMVSPGGKLKPGRVVHVAPGFDVRVESVTERRTRVVSLLTEDDAAGGAEAAIERHGHIPLPPYIERPDAADDAERYQTVYSRESGSVAAPTAGLHFTPELLARLAAQGVERAEVLLHVGAGTFKPLDVEDPAEHPMHEEWYDVSPDAAARVNAVHARGGKVWAVGTTSTRTLESATDAGGTLHAGSGETRLFIYPPYRFRCVDHLVTNFHLPRSTLVMLVAAFAGYDLTMRAYEAAIAERYRFFSYGDAMLII
jgi:S-adenosylmethionine:tRNA ribosyltransferase-isomerase